MASSEHPLRVGIYGTGSWANKTHIPINDYHDGLFSLAPVLAGWESARRQGECMDVAAFMEA